MLTGINFNVNEYPQKHWIDNFTFSIDNIIVQDGGSGYTTPPTVIITGGGGQDATAQAYIGSGAVTSIVVTNGGSGYTSTPTINIVGTQSQDGILPNVTVVLSNKKVRTLSVKQKFDRITPNFELLSLPETETFTNCWCCLYSFVSRSVPFGWQLIYQIWRPNTFTELDSTG